MPVIEYKCPNCGSGMTFHAESGTLSCPSCNTQKNIEEFPDPLKKQVFTTEDEVKEYHCNSCGADIMMEEHTSATNCSFCGAAVVLGDRLSGELAPAMVIPFSISKKQAEEAFRKWCKNGLLTPKGFMTADRIKSITGMYVPFWLYGLHNDIEVQAKGTKVRSYRRGDYQITETQHFDIYRKIHVNYNRVPIDASVKMNDELMDKLEPFPYQQLKDFKTPYLAGYVAEKYNFTDEELFPRAKQKIQKYVDAYIASSVSGYTSVSYTNKKIDTSITQTDYVMLPVWMVHYDYNRQHYTFAMNGQTGKVVGKPPISKGKVAAWFGGISGASLLTMKIISWAMGGGFL